MGSVEIFEVRMEGIVSLSCLSLQDGAFRSVCIYHRLHTPLSISQPGHEEAGVNVNTLDGSYLRVNNSKYQAIILFSNCVFITQR